LVYLGGIASVALCLAAVGLIWNGRSASMKAEAEERVRDAEAGPTVRVTRPQVAPPVRKLQLQGEARPFASVTLYAKVSGYLKEVRVDKGDRVHENQIVAVIESPELDRQYDAAVADAHYKRAEAQRAAALAGPGVVSARQAELEESEAHVSAANVAALGTQRSYETLRAPFSGDVTARFADPGALVQNAANAQTGALPVVTISQTARLRVYVYVDQRDAGLVRVGDSAEIAVPGKGVKKAPVTRLARELDPRTRMMLVEIDIGNADGSIIAGSFVEVKLLVKASPGLELPAEALLVRDKKPHVAVVKDGVVHYQPVVLAEDDGATVRIESGLDAGQEVALNLGDSVAEGGRVRPKENAKR
jgi:RND family efflux transporter MFP subunit